MSVRNKYALTFDFLTQPPWDGVECWYLEGTGVMVGTSILQDCFERRLRHCFIGYPAESGERVGV